jgi:hypothetical protein
LSADDFIKSSIPIRRRKRNELLQIERRIRRQFHHRSQFLVRSVVAAMQPEAELSASAMVRAQLTQKTILHRTRQPQPVCRAKGVGAKLSTWGGQAIQSSVSATEADSA